MLDRLAFGRPRPGIVLALVLLGTSLTGCASSDVRRDARLEKDSGTCASFGGAYGSPEYAQCMLAQQERRDTKGLRAMEQARLSSETASNNLEMIRQMRCDKQARRDRKAGEHPRPCR